MSRNAADCLIQCLEHEWVEYVFWVPGEENLHVLDALSHSSIKLILTRNEQTAVFMACSYGRMTGKAGVALATLGPGATNMLTGVAHAQLGAMPLIVITGQKAIKTSKQWLFQIIDVCAMMQPISKRSTTIVSGSRIPTIVRQAFALAQAERPGVVHLELPEDIAEEQVDDWCQPILLSDPRRPHVDTKAFIQLVDMLKSAKCPMILVGSGANRKRITKYLTQFINQTQIPFFTSQMGKGVVDESSVYYIGTASLTQKDHIHALISQADCIVAIGYDPVEKPAMFVDYQHQKLIHINFFAATIDEVYQPCLQIIWDIADTCRQLCESDLHAWLRHYDIFGSQIEELHRRVYDGQDTGSVMWPHQLARDLRHILGPDDILALDNGLYKLWLTRNYPAYRPNTILVDNALATMGAGYSIAMASKLLYPDRHVIAVVGDGGLMMNLWDLETVVRLWLNITIVIVRDDAYGMIKWKQQAMNLNDYGLDFGNPDFVLLAQSFGAQWLRLMDKKDFPILLKEGLQYPWLTLIDVPFAYPAQIT